MSRSLFRRWIVTLGLVAQVIGAFATCACGNRDDSARTANVAMSCHGEAADARVLRMAACCCDGQARKDTSRVVATAAPCPMIAPGAVEAPRAISSLTFHRASRADPQVPHLT